ncbi:MAG: hypothetical protein E8D45_01305 [Nitrospira sp.]|nr:MAG: hypothetical protein E8D45_01305 [Nitrospira sp.]
MSGIASLWSIHQCAHWPKGMGSHEGPLMTLDTVISGCVTYYLDEQRLDPPRIEMLEDCLADLEALLPDITGEAGDYFRRLHDLGRMLLEH